MLKKLMALIKYAKVPAGIVHASIHQESGLDLLLVTAKHDLAQIENIRKLTDDTMSGKWRERKTREIAHLEKMIEMQKELTTYLQSCRRLAG